jgi:hypothetical protein
MSTYSCYANHGVNAIGDLFDLVYIFLFVIFYLFCWMMVVFLCESEGVKKSEFRKILLGLIILLQIAFAVFIYSVTFEIVNGFSKIVILCLSILLVLPIISSLYFTFSKKNQK